MSKELNWTEKEIKDIGLRVVNLRQDQIAALIIVCGVEFNRDDIENVVMDIKTNKEKSGHLEIVIYEAESKEKFLWWLEFFEKYNK